MRIEAHLEKVRRLDAVRQRLAPAEDFELWFWMSMSGGTHALNAALHAVGATSDGHVFPTQAVDVYLEPGPTAGTFRPAIRFGCDILHVGMPRVEVPIPSDLEQACGAMEVLETFRDGCVRGDRAITPGIIEAVDAAYTRCLALTAGVLRASGRPA
jgi:hypothetical protein